MSASQHMVRVMRNSSQPPSKRPLALPPRARTALLISLTCGVLYLVVVYTGPQLRYLVSGLQGSLSLSHYVGR